ncbi:MAG: bifunctional hydroxymethylpyrimidine kinase/phosphomethylpyrimidine kinase [Desulfatiglandaceae bacterium]|jgi:hydroxymethylpyrimidine kinase/phosphomethylpyrimidine kinase
MKRILTIAGSDSGGGAGIQADLKTITVLGGYGMSAITALTAQNTIGVQGVHPVPVDFIKLQMESVLSDYGADAAKTGMLATPEIVSVVAGQLERYDIRLLVVDPVMVAKSGDILLSEDARVAMGKILLPLAHVVTPNLPEASELCGFPVEDLDGMKKAARKIHELGSRHVLVKGGHLKGEAVDVLFDGKDFHLFHAPRLSNRNTHGTGCTYSAALATLLGQGFEVPEAVRKAKAFITRAISLGLDFGSGHGPTNHYAHVLRFIEREQVLKELHAAARKLLGSPVGNLIPEVRSNLGYALPGALCPDEVAAFPGRISQVDEWPLIFHDPTFEASRHIAEVILETMACEPGMRSAMNIRYSEATVAACRTRGFQGVLLDRDVQVLGIRKAIGAGGRVPDILFDKGGMGREPMIHVLGRDPMEVLGKVLRIGETPQKHT